MKKTLTLLFTLLFLASSLLVAAEFEDQHQQPSCLYCGMDRIKFGHSRILIEYEKNPSVAVCSLHCAAIELALGVEKTPTNILVGDFNSRQLIDAEEAFWVIGGKKPGVMTLRGKWAFSDNNAAESFVSSNGGIITDFDHAMRASYEDMYKDTMMIRNKRKMKRMKMQQMRHGKK